MWENIDTLSSAATWLASPSWWWTSVTTGYCDIELLAAWVLQEQIKLLKYRRTIGYLDLTNWCRAATWAFREISEGIGVWIRKGEGDMIVLCARWNPSRIWAKPVFKGWPGNFLEGHPQWYSLFITVVV